MSRQPGPLVVTAPDEVDWVSPPLPPGARVLLVGAHPDDETIGAGRLVSGHDGPVRAVTLSGGERCVVDDRLAPADLERRRLAEWRTAAARLGVEALETPRWADGALAEHEAEITGLLVGLLGDCDAVVVVWRHDPHPDHRAAGRAAATAAGTAGVPVVEYPVWAPYWMTLAEVDGLRHRICATRTTGAADRARRHALAAYVSQTRSLLPGIDPIVPAAMLARHDRQLLVVPVA